MVEYMPIGDKISLVFPGNSILLCYLWLLNLYCEEITFFSVTIIFPFKVSSFAVLSFWLQVSEKKEIGNLKRRMKEVSQLHDATLNELQSLKSEYKDLLSDKVWLESE